MNPLFDLSTNVSCQCFRYQSIKDFKHEEREELKCHPVKNFAVAWSSCIDKSIDPFGMT